MAAVTNDVHLHNKPIDLGWKNLNQSKFTLITFTASFTLRVMTYPLSLLKTNHQTRSLSPINTTSSKLSEPLIQQIFKTQGIRGFYKGISINLIGNASHVLYATIYETSREFIQNKLYSFGYINNDTFIAPFSSGISGIFASTCQLLISTPFDIISQQRMILKGSDMHSIRAKDVFRRILNEEKSIFGLWRGLTLSLMTYAPTSGVVWSTYRYIKPKLYKKISFADEEKLNFLSGGISGGIGGLLTMPLDTIKVRKQVLAKRSTKGIDIVKNVYNEFGILGFWRGVVPRTCQYSLTCAIIMTVYGWVKRTSAQS